LTVLKGTGNKKKVLVKRVFYPITFGGQKLNRKRFAIFSQKNTHKLIEKLTL